MLRKRHRCKQLLNRASRCPKVVADQIYSKNYGNREVPYPKQDVILIDIVLYHNYLPEQHTVPQI